MGELYPPAGTEGPAVRKCEGLTAAQLGQRSCPPSELTLLGLVRHLTEIERNGHADLLRGAIDGATGE
jgi:hypothetical protein